MVFSYDLNTAIGEVRLLCQDTNESQSIFTDAEIQIFLKTKGGNVLRAAAVALDVMASNQAIVLKVTRALDLSTDGAAVARALRESAKQLRAEADETDAGEDAGFEMVAGPHFPWTYGLR